MSEEEIKETGSLFPEFSYDATDIDLTENKSDGNPIAARNFHFALQGYDTVVTGKSQMYLMIFGAMVKGRVAIMDCRSMATSRYLINIGRWREQCKWLHHKTRNGKRIEYLGIPGLQCVASVLFGVETARKGKIKNSLILEVPEASRRYVYTYLTRALLPCIWDGKRLPYDLVLRAINLASHPQSFTERYNWEHALSLACSFVKKYRNDLKKEEWNLALDKECDIRDSLYGRLLAVADRIEYITYGDTDGKRVTNAKRYMTAFSQRPYETWKIIEENIQPYLAKMKPGTRVYFEGILNDIYRLYTVDSYRDNTRLEGIYLLGYHSQSYEMSKKKEEENANE